MQVSLHWPREQSILAWSCWGERSPKPRLEFERDTAVEGEPFERGCEAVEFFAASVGPLIMLRGRPLPSRARVADARQPLRSPRAPGQYLVVLGRKATVP
jgi:hypothetical protein